MFGGWLADRFGGKWLFGGGILGASVLTLLTPTAAYLHLVAVIAVRTLEGLLEGFVITATYALLSRWTPTSQTTRAGTMVYSGEYCGYIIAMLLAGFLSDHGFAGGWPSVFYVFGTVGCVWSAAWFLLCHSSPSAHPRISKAEREQLEATTSINSKEVVDRPKTPWRKIFTSMPLLSCCVGKFANLWCNYTLVNGLPLFFYDVLGFSMTNNGLMASLPYMAAGGMILIAGQAADWLRAPGRLSTTTVRKIFCVCGMVFPSILFIVAGFLGCDRAPVVLTMIAAMGCQICAWASLSVNPMDLCASNAATLFGMTNSIGTLGSIVAPLVIGQITYGSSTITQWRKVFYIAFGVEWFGAIVYLLFGSGEPQNWQEDAK